MTVKAARPKDVIWRGKPVPAALRDLGALMRVVANDRRISSNQFIPALAAFADTKMKAEAMAFLTPALNGRFTSAELKGLLNQIAPDIRFSDAKDAQEFLQSLADELSKDT